MLTQRANQFLIATRIGLALLFLGTAGCSSGSSHTAVDAMAGNTSAGGTSEGSAGAGGAGQGGSSTSSGSTGVAGAGGSTAAGDTAGATVATGGSSAAGGQAGIGSTATTGGSVAGSTATGGVAVSGGSMGTGGAASGGATGGAGGKPGSGGGAAAGTSGSGTGGASGGIVGGTGGASLGGQGGAGDSPVVPVRLRCELQDAPLGIQTATPRLAWELQSSDSKARGLSQSAYEVLVASSLDKLSAGQGDLLSTGSVTSTESSLVYSGQTLGSWTHAYWKVRVRDQAARMSTWSAPSEFTVGLLATTDWGAQWISGGAGTALPIFRKEFTVSKTLTRALVSICGLGQFELRVNGSNVSDAVMEPSWTNYTKNCHYVTYDVTKAIVQGNNALGVLLGNGMYNVPTSSRYAKFTGSFGSPKLILRLLMEFSDGTKDAVVSDTSWTATAGPITFTSIYGGEDFDARQEPAGWDKAGFAATSWKPATVASGTAPSLIARSAPPVKVMQEFPSTKTTQPQSGVFVYDLGQNFSGWPEITVQGTAGSTVKLTTGELLTAQGVVTQASSGSPVWFSYTLQGSGSEVWHPRFSYTGFRYVQVDGAVPAAQAASFPGKPQIASLTGKFIYASAETVGTFTSSDQDLNKIHALILAALRSNLQNIITDCPHREKLGWLETSHLLFPSIMFNFDVAAFYEKFIRDARDAQTSTGLVPDIAPEFTVFSGDFRDSPEWGSAYVINPWYLYQAYGDRAALDEHYANMKRYVSYVGGKASGNIVSDGLGDWYDVGPAAPGNSQLTTAGVTATAIYLQDLQVMQKAAQLLGNQADATQFASSITTTTNAYNAKFLTSGGSYDRNSQTANAMPLALGLVPTNQQAAVLSSLVGAVTAAKNQVTAGDIGFAYVIRALSQAGRGDVIYSMLKQSTGPGYLDQIKNGATALTEAWDANPADSQNHAMLGHAEEWLYNGLGGINPDPTGPGFKKFFIHPQPQAGLASVDAEYHSIRGLIVSNWQQGATGLTLSVTVPVNTTATITIPTKNPAAVTESGAPAATAAGVISNTAQASALELVVGSGQYVFTAP
jgi:alpha-L-rhamnosidase